MSAPGKPFFLQALDALKSGDRRGAAVLLGRQLSEGNTSAKNLGPVAELAAHIGEVELAVDARRRAVVPGSMDTLIEYWGTLATYGRSDDALADIERQPSAIRDHPSVLHVRGTIATQLGRFEEAQDLFRRALARAPAMTASWLSLAMITKFTSGDRDFATMERLEGQLTGQPEDRTMLSYALGKAYEDIGEFDRAFGSYENGAALRRKTLQVDLVHFATLADRIMRDFTPANLNLLIPSGFTEQRSLFVTGLPRSGTTLTAQILLNHSAVTAGEEVNLFGTALIPTLGIGIDNALAYQQRSKRADPWGEIGRDYTRLIDMRFRSRGLVVDKSLGQSILIGLMLHAMPDARVAWLRRSPDDVALSCFRTYFATGLGWTWSLVDIANYMRVEDRLFEHWRALFPERILVVRYEELASAPALWAKRLQQHFGLPTEDGIESLSRNDRAIGTASVSQVREPISTSRIGQAAAFERHLKPFRDRYYS